MTNTTLDLSHQVDLKNNAILAKDFVATGKLISQGTLTVDGAQTFTGTTTLTGGVIYGAGTTTVAPVTYTAGSLLTSPVVGAVEFDSNGLYITPAASSRSIIDAEQYIIQVTEPAADNNGGLDSNTAAAFFTAGSGQITLTTGKTYFFEACYMLTNTGTTSHTWGHQFGGTAAFTALGTGYQGWGISSTGNGTGTTGGGGGMVTGFTATGSTSKITALTQASTSATENATIQVVGTLVVATGGTLIPQLIASARPGASGTPGVTHKAGSFFRIWEVSTASTVGNWS